MSLTSDLVLSCLVTRRRCRFHYDYPLNELVRPAYFVSNHHASCFDLAITHYQTLYLTRQHLKRFTIRLLRPLYNLSRHFHTIDTLEP